MLRKCLRGGTLQLIQWEVSTGPSWGAQNRDPLLLGGQPLGCYWRCDVAVPRPHYKREGVALCPALLLGFIWSV